jgi:hypothetical protein
VILDPFERFLGVPRFSDAMTLLGLTPQRCEPLDIENALHERLKKVYQHPDARSDDADDIRAALRAAAEQLRRFPRSVRSTQRPGDAAAPSAPQRLSVASLTQFDRLVLAVLVGCGGWNAQSRSRLVALASSYGVTVQGLMRVMQGLSDYARSGGPHLGTSEIMSVRPAWAISAGSTSSEPQLLDRITQKLAVELRRDDPWPTIRLSILFGAITVLVGVVVARLALRSESRPPSQLPTPPAAVVNSASSTPPVAKTLRRDCAQACHR